MLNSSPIISLSKCGFGNLPESLFQRVVIPEAVWREVNVGKNFDPKIFESAANTQIASTFRDSRVTLWNLGNGETAVISQALHLPSSIAILDDLAARRAAGAFQVRHMGTAGLLVMASRLNLISDLKTALFSLRENGLFLKENLIFRLLENEKKRE